MNEALFYVVFVNEAFLSVSFCWFCKQSLFVSVCTSKFCKQSSLVLFFYVGFVNNFFLRIIYVALINETFLFFVVCVLKSKNEATLVFSLSVQ